MNLFYVPFIRFSWSDCHLAKAFIIWKENKYFANPSKIEFEQHSEKQQQKSERLAEFVAVVVNLNESL